MVLVAMPAIFVGVQIFGAAGWAWSTASLARVSCLSYSLALYMTTIGPLTHMQAERRAFWILRAVPVPLGRLLAAKARAWAVIVGATAAVTFAALCFLMPPAPLSAVIGSGVLVTGGAVAMSFLAVAMSSGGADLSDDQSPAVGPTTIYAFLLVGGLYNLVLTGDAATRAAGLLLYVFTLAAYWADGVARAEICYDAEAIRAPRLRMADGATLALLAALAARGLASVAASARARRWRRSSGWALACGSAGPRWAAVASPRRQAARRLWRASVVAGGLGVGGRGRRVVGVGADRDRGRRDYLARRAARLRRTQPCGTPSCAQGRGRPPRAAACRDCHVGAQRGGARVGGRHLGRGPDSRRRRDRRARRQRARVAPRRRGSGWC